MMLNKPASDRAPPVVVSSLTSDRPPTSTSAFLWSTPGSIIARRLEGEGEVWAVHETVLADGTHYVTVAIVRRDKALTFRVFDAEEAARQCFTRLKIDVLVTTQIAKDDLHGMNESGLFHLLRVA